MLENRPGRAVYFGGLCVILITAISGCFGGKSPTTRYYALRTGDLIGEGNGELKIAVGPFELPDFLNRPQIVIRNQETNLTILKYDRWAEPLGESFNRRVNTVINNEIKSGFAYRFPSPTDISPDYRIRGRIYDFGGYTDGTVTLKLRWAVLARDQNFVVAPRGATYSVKLDSVSDITAVTVAMDNLIDELSQDIVTELRNIGIE